MAHTRAWNVTQPPGTELAKNIDNQARDLRVDIGERISDFVVDIMADPLVLKPELTGTVVGKKLMIPFSSFTTSNFDKEITYFYGNINAFTDSWQLNGTVDVPVGCTITKIEVMIDRADTSSVEAVFFARTFAAGGSRPGSNSAPVALGHVFTTGPNVQVLEITPLTVLIDEDTMYWITIAALGPAGDSYDFFGARVTYDTPDNRNTR